MFHGRLKGRTRCAKGSCELHIKCLMSAALNLPIVIPMPMKSQLSWTSSNDSLVVVHILPGCYYPHYFRNCWHPRHRVGLYRDWQHRRHAASEFQLEMGSFLTVISSRCCCQTIALGILCAVSEGQQVMMSCLNQGTLDTFAKTRRRGTHQNKSYIRAKNFQANTCQAVST